jgi:hypothetical protein
VPEIVVLVAADRESRRCRSACCGRRRFPAACRGLPILSDLAHEQRVDDA